jgi:hypothetical protein
MAYPQSGSHHNYMIPNVPLATTTAGVLREMDIGASSADHGEMLCVNDCTVKRLQFTLVGEAAGGSGTAPTVIFTKRPTPLSATAESVMGTLTIPDGTAIGASIYLDVDVDLAVGDSVEISHTIGITGPTGQGFWSMVCADKPDSAANNSELTASA